jgi:hypothetical protein
MLGVDDASPSVVSGSMPPPGPPSIARMSSLSLGNVRNITNVSELDNMVRTASTSFRVLVVLVTAVGSPEGQAFRRHLSRLSSAHLRSMFGVVDFDNAVDVAQRLDVSLYPAVVLFAGAGTEKKVLYGSTDTPLLDTVPPILGELEALMVAAAATRGSLPPSPRTPGSDPGWPGAGAGAGGGADGASGVGRERAPVKTKTNVLVKRKKPEDDSGETPPDLDVWAALEEVLGKMGLTLEQIRDMLEKPDFPPQHIVDAVMGVLPAGARPGDVRSMLGAQRGKVLEKVKQSLEMSKRAKTEKERKVQEHIRSIGLCPVGFEWLPDGDGYRCAGGSHFISRSQLPNFLQ